MNRRKMLALSTGFGVAALGSTKIGGQDRSQLGPANSLDSRPWFLHEDELKTGVTLYNNKIARKTIVTNRRDFPPDKEKLVRMAEAVYPSNNPGLRGPNGNPMWYMEENYKVPFNVTMRAVNYFFDRAARDNRLRVTYTVDIFEVVPITKESSNVKNLYDLPTVTEVSLTLGYTADYGNTGYESLGAWKRVFFDKEEIVALYMSPKPQVVMS